VGEALRPRDTGAGRVSYTFAHIPIDVDGDGWTDIVDAAWHNRAIFWVRNPGTSGGPFEVIDIEQPGNMETAIPVDVNGDGKVDVLPNIAGSAAWYEYHHDKAARAACDGQARSAKGGRGARDGRRRCEQRRALRHCRNGRLAGAGRGRRLDMARRVPVRLGEHPILALDVDGDGDNDILSGMAHDYGFYWLEQQQQDGKRTWAKHEIDRSWSQVHFLLPVDLDNDKVDEIVTGKRYRATTDTTQARRTHLCVRVFVDRSAKKWNRRPLHEGGRSDSGSIRWPRTWTAMAISMSSVRARADCTCSRTCCGRRGAGCIGAIDACLSARACVEC